MKKWWMMTDAKKSGDDLRNEWRAVPDMGSIDIPGFKKNREIVADYAKAVSLLRVIAEHIPLLEKEMFLPRKFLNRRIDLPYFPAYIDLRDSGAHRLHQHFAYVEAIAKTLAQAPAAYGVRKWADNAADLLSVSNMLKFEFNAAHMRALAKAPANDERSHYKHILADNARHSARMALKELGYAEGDMMAVLDRAVNCEERALLQPVEKKLQRHENILRFTLRQYSADADRYNQALAPAKTQAVRCFPG